MLFIHNSCAEDVRNKQDLLAKEEVIEIEIEIEMSLIFSPPAFSLTRCYCFCVFCFPRRKAIIFHSPLQATAGVVPVASCAQRLCVI